MSSCEHGGSVLRNELSKLDIVVRDPARAMAEPLLAHVLKAICKAGGICSPNAPLSTVDENDQVDENDPLDEARAMDIVVEKVRSVRRRRRSS